VVDAAGAPLADAVVFLEDGAPAAPTTATLDQVDKQFVPRLLVIPRGTTVSFPNRDQIHHHVYSFSPAKTFEIPLYKGEQAAPVVFDEVGAVKLGCNIHDWMSGVILVVPNGVFAVTGADGAFTLRDVPDGAVTVVAWHEGSKTALDASAQRVESGAAAPLRFVLDSAPRRGRRGGGGRSYE
jgi:plastocyanin